MKSSVVINAIIGLIFPVMSSCSGCAETEHTEEITAEITAAQMEGRSAARSFVNREWKDSTKLQQLLIEAKSRRGKYIDEGKPECAAAYDSAFISTIRAVRPELARSIERRQ